MEHHTDIAPLLTALRKRGKPVVLVGLMGAGKSTIGRRLSRTLDFPFIDADDEIVAAAGCSISDIFAVYGEDIFRDLERRVVNRLLKEERHSVIATGGGAFLQPELRALIKEHGISIWLRAELDILVERTSRRNTRPLLEQGDKRDILSKMIRERYATYGEADIVVDSDDGLHERVVERIIAELHQSVGLDSPQKTEQG